MFFTFSLATYYTGTYFTKAITHCLGLGRESKAHYILRNGRFGFRPPFEDTKRKFISLPVEDCTEVACLRSEQPLRMCDDLVNNLLDLILQDERRVFPDVWLLLLEACLRNGLRRSPILDNTNACLRNGLPRSPILDPMNDPLPYYTAKGKFGILVLPDAQPSPSPASKRFEQDDRSMVWSDAQGHHAQQDTTMTSRGYTWTYSKYTFTSTVCPVQTETTTETLTDPTGLKTATKTTHYWTDGLSSRCEQTSALVSITSDGYTNSNTEEIRESDYSVLGKGVECATSRSECAVVVGNKMIIDRNVTTTTDTGYADTYENDTFSCTEKYVYENNLGSTSYSETQSSTDESASVTQRRRTYETTITDDEEYFKDFVETTQGDEYTWQVTEGMLRKSDEHFTIRQYGTGEGYDVSNEDRRHIYLQN